MGIPVALVGGLELACLSVVWPGACQGQNVGMANIDSVPLSPDEVGLNRV